MNNQYYYPTEQMEVDAVESHFLGIGAGLKLAGGLAKKIRDNRIAKGKQPIIGSIFNKIRENRIAKGKKVLLPGLGGGQLMNKLNAGGSPTSSQATSFDVMDPNTRGLEIALETSAEAEAEAKALADEEKKKKNMMYAGIGLAVIIVIVVLVIKFKK